ncbi:MAG: PaaI family thioesterase [Rhodoferax sp.]|uniref:PaaI family thioesterase n=1 Tax=Rhodoferax sp. TaxID=50421 RepID=UPI0026399367|nr:PaaI family thioesterase [Rhodoferax sp.]MDD2879124.1 PaaI family thioesterase [Rhodoferax sp.]
MTTTHNITLPTTDFGKTNPFIAHLGFVLTKFDNGQSELHYTAKPEHLNSYSVTHGGAVMTLLDVTMAMAARADHADLGVVTIEMKTSFMRPSHGPLIARGKLLHRTATLAFTEATVFDEHGKACAHATGTFKYIRRLPVGPKSSHPLNGSVDDAVGSISIDQAD